MKGRPKEEGTKAVRVPESLALGVREFMNLYRSQRKSDDPCQMVFKVNVVDGRGVWEIETNSAEKSSQI